MTHILNSLTTVVTKCSLDLFGRFKGCNCNNHLINNTHLVVKNRVQLDRYVLANILIDKRMILICRVIMSFEYTLEFHVLIINTFEKAIIHFMIFIPSMIAKKHLLSLPIKILITLTLKGEINENKMYIFTRS